MQFQLLYLLLVLRLILLLSMLSLFQGCMCCRMCKNITDMFPADHKNNIYQGISKYTQSFSQYTATQSKMYILIGMLFLCNILLNVDVIYLQYHHNHFHETHILFPRLAFNKNTYHTKEQLTPDLYYAVTKIYRLFNPILLLLQFL